MSDDLTGLEFALMFRTNDPALREGLEQIVPADDISASDNFIGGTEIAIFLKYGKDVLKSILEFLGPRKAAIANAKIVVGKEEFYLEGYSAADAEKILNSPGFQEALRLTHTRQ
jgi:hypothetical protein